jgi:hypothetical protein
MGRGIKGEVSNLRRIQKFRQFDNRNSSFGISTAPVTLNWPTSKKSLSLGFT